MRTLILTTIFLSAVLTSNAQVNVQTINVSTDGQVEVAADRIHFRITINAGADYPEKAYEMHKEREAKLVQLLEQYDIDERQIRYQPISINRNSNRREYNQPTVQTSQMVNLTLDDFKVFERIQVGLIEAGYDNFSGSFTSSKIDSAGNEALRRAVAGAREKAEILAGEAGVNLGGIQEITYGQSSVNYGGESLQLRSNMAMDESLSQYAQTVVVTRSVTVRYIIMQ